MLFRKVWGSTDNMFTNKVFFADQCPNGDYILVGLTTVGSWGDYWFYFARTDSTGTILIENKWGGGNSENRIARVIETSQGNYLVCGSAASGAGSFALFGIDEYGILQFSQYYDFGLGDLAFDITPTLDSCYVICGLMSSFSSTACPAFVKVDRYGNEIWRRTQSAYLEYSPLFIRTTSDSGFIVSGVRNTNDNSYYAKYDKEGQMIWMSYQFGISDTFPDQPEAVHCNADGTFEIYYSVEFLSGNPPAADKGRLVHYDSLGDTIWTKIFYEPIDHIFGNEGTKMLAIDNSMRYLTIDTSGQITWLIEDAVGSIEYCIQTLDGGILSVGSSDTYQSNYWNLQFQISKYGKDGRYEPMSFLDNIILFPNPAFEGTASISFDTQTEENVHVQVWSMDGKLMYSYEIFCPANSHTKLPLNLDEATACGGMYIVELRTSTEYRRERLIIGRNND